MKSLNRRSLLCGTALFVLSVVPAWANPLLLYFARRTLAGIAQRVIVAGMRRLAAGSRLAQNIVSAANKAYSVVSNISDAKELVHLVKEWGGEHNGQIRRSPSEIRTTKQNIDHVIACPTCKKTVKAIVNEAPPPVRREIMNQAGPELEAVLVDETVTVEKRTTPKRQMTIQGGW